MESILISKTLEGVFLELANLRELFEGLAKSLSVNPEKLFYTSKEVKDMFDINDGTLSTWRAQGILKGKKIRGTWYYKAENVLKIAD